MWAAAALALVLCGFAGHRIARRGLRPLQALVGSVRSVGAGSLRPRVDSRALPPELQPLGDTFNDMFDRLQRSFDRVSQFSDDIAHELRTPLQVMAGQIDVALEATGSVADYREVLESAREEIAVLSALVDRLLFLSRIENHSVALAVQELAVAAELQAIHEFYEPLAGEAGVELALAPVDPELSADGDRLLIRRAVGNLVANAIRHTPAGGRVVLAATQSGAGVSIAVSDTGCGIAADQLPRIADRFVRLDPAREPGGGHIGLGLAIVAGIAELHRGRIDIASTVGEGTTVTLLLPDP
jgi:two-component system heavy metal sensor histidine kinase CusS